jgi:acyl carrier protein
MVKKNEFLRLMEEAVEADAGTITCDDAIESIEGWDSVAIISFIAMVDEKFGVTISPKKIEDAKYVSDLMTLI